MFNQLGVPQNSFKDMRVAANQKRLKTLIYSMFFGILLEDVGCPEVEITGVDNPESLAAINFSSGTTGYPKAIPMTHKIISDRALSDKTENA
jgi:long-subunit acyl-CoA synthetase (AMP-forming)